MNSLLIAWEIPLICSRFDGNTPPSLKRESFDVVSLPANAGILITDQRPSLPFLFFRFSSRPCSQHIHIIHIFFPHPVQERLGTMESVQW
jgi:hypothetical protein